MTTTTWSYAGRPEAAAGEDDAVEGPAAALDATPSAAVSSRAEPAATAARRFFVDRRASMGGRVRVRPGRTKGCRSRISVSLRALPSMRWESRQRTAHRHRSVFAGAFRDEKAASGRRQPGQIPLSVSGSELSRQAADRNTYRLQDRVV